MHTTIELENVKKAAAVIKDVVEKTPLLFNRNLSEQLDADIYFKREDLQQVRSYKIRGAYHKISSLTKEELEKGVVCASAGNHAQGVALSCYTKQIKGVVFMPAPTPRQKIDQVKMFGGKFIEVVLVGDTYDDAQKKALEYAQKNKMAFIHPFDDIKVIEGQATVGLEILSKMKKPIDYLFVPVGGGGLSAGIISVFSKMSPKTKIIGVEPEGAPSLTEAVKFNKNIEVKITDTFVDGACVKKIGDKNFSILKDKLSRVATVPEGKVCQTILDLYNKDAIVVEPAGALSVSALDLFKEEIKGKNVVCIISGGNNDITRTEEIKERALLYSGLKHYFVIRFPQRAGALRDFLDKVLGPEDDITHFEYSKKHNRNSGPAVVGLLLKDADQLQPLISRMKDKKFFVEYLNEKPDLFQFLV